MTFFRSSGFVIARQYIRSKKYIANVLTIVVSLLLLAADDEHNDNDHDDEEDDAKYQSNDPHIKACRLHHSHWKEKIDH